LLLVLALWLAGGAAEAHRLQVFAFAEGARIEGSAYFAGDGAAVGARLSVRDAAGKLLAELAPDSEGHFSYTATVPIDHVIVAETGDGHRAEWRVSAAELVGSFPAAAEPAVGSATAKAAAPPSGPSPMVSTAGIAARDPALMSAIESAVSRQLRPLREQLIAMRDRTRLQDILGGIGYIFGLTGLALWWRSRRPDGSR
jgi:nickel transport protein